MKEYITCYMNEVEAFLGKINETSDAEKKIFLDELNTKISFFQHERLIHLIVTALFAVMEIISVVSASVFANLPSVILSVMFLVLLIPYVAHYYFLENSVQKMYKQRDCLVASIGNKSNSVQ